MTANNYMMQFMKVSFMPAFGLSSAVTALVGRYIGMNRLDLARQRAHLGFKVTLVYMLGCGLMFFLRAQSAHLAVQQGPGGNPHRRDPADVRRDLPAL